MPPEQRLAQELQIACVDQMSHSTCSQQMTILWSSQNLCTIFSQYHETSKAAIQQLLSASTASLNSRDTFLLVQVLSKSEYAMPKAQSQTLVQCIQNNLQDMSLSNVVTLTINLSKVKMRRSLSLIHKLALAVVAHLEDADSAQLSWFIWALGRYRTPIPWKVMSLLLDHFKSWLPWSNGSDIARVLFSLPWLCQPGPDNDRVLKKRKLFLLDLARKSQECLPDCTPQELVWMLRGFNRLSYYPGAIWMKLHRNACRLREAQFDPVLKDKMRAEYQRILSLG
ncbi:hypothetical protein CEUSTIGMA_g4286.t1 [Chlamydomonas eustigma]|uniref:Nucleolar pre-ribosomal-associated protein 1 C-terminal domain-containing protein n=1 Tax=Chlamydomonas eustigma TaxID=1157962 RepID=A0A250X269_9CHLO|nr:hypothetical protein CEUSTIGMA_g4286.t1 [Chlamydomonas eustigma]|eukprot:GAX76840.1 hypothetical protein CEUSTIGMA_g4286.t1 [Chlamydomonas eustigma]